MFGWKLGNHFWKRMESWAFWRHFEGNLRALSLISPGLGKLKVIGHHGKGDENGPCGSCV